jgi:hypothetical protein
VNRKKNCLNGHLCLSVHCCKFWYALSTHNFPMPKRMPTLILQMQINKLPTIKTLKKVSFFHIKYLNKQFLLEMKAAKPIIPIVTAELTRLMDIPAKMVAETLKTLLTRINLSNVIERMNSERAWTNITTPTQYISAVGFGWL